MVNKYLCQCHLTLPAPKLLSPPACSNIHVAIVTAAGYPGAPERFEQRVEGLLAAFRQLNLPQHITDRCARWELQRMQRMQSGGFS